MAEDTSLQYGPIQRWLPAVQSGNPGMSIPLSLRGSGPDPAQMGVQDQITSGVVVIAGDGAGIGAGVGAGTVSTSASVLTTVPAYAPASMSGSVPMPVSASVQATMLA